MLTERTGALAPVSVHAAHLAVAIKLGLFLEPRHRLRVVPAGTVEIVVVLVAVFPQPSPHVAQYLMTPKSPTPHLNLSIFAGATRVDSFRVSLVISCARAVRLRSRRQTEGASQVHTSSTSRSPRAPPSTAWSVRPGRRRRL